MSLFQCLLLLHEAIWRSRDRKERERSCLEYIYMYTLKGGGGMENGDGKGIAANFQTISAAAAAAMVGIQLLCGCLYSYNKCFVAAI